jgi:CDP-diacylglycerol--serine O-phosphatidyltransferase
MKKHIPNFITSLNLVCGCIGLGFLFKSNLNYSTQIVYAAWCIVFAALFDFLDGMFARLLHVKSAIGKELDSLADMVSFGVLPGFIMYAMLDQCVGDAEGWKAFIPFIAFLIPVFSALRLAKFNIDTRQTDKFIGLPTPANAIFIASIPFILYYQPNKVPAITTVLANPGFLIVLTFILSFLLVAPLPLFAMKFKDMSWAKNSIRYIFIILTIILLILFSFVAIPIILLLYIFLSIISNPLKK